MQEALAFVLANLSNPKEIYDTCVRHGISSQMLAEIVEGAEPGVDANAVRNFFSTKGFDGVALDLAYFNTLKAKSNLSSYGAINDTITLGDGNDVVDSGLGNDTINGNGGDDYLIGGSGDDKIYGGKGSDYISGGFGSDTLEGGLFYEWVSGHYEGNQWVPGYYAYDEAPNVINGDGGDDRITGGYGADVLDGGDGADTISGGGSYYGATSIQDHDLIYGRGGDDRLYGEDGNDVIYGGSGNDTIDGGRDADTLYGEAGNDTMRAGSDSVMDTLFGGDGNDIIYIGEGDQANGGAGNDQIYFDGPYSTTLATTALIVAGEGADKISVTDLSDSTRVILDLTETTQAKDDITNWSVSSSGSASNTVLEIRGFNVKYDTFNVGSFDPYDSSGYLTSAGYVSNYSSYNYTQILTSPSTAYLPKSSANPKTPDSYGKGFFVIQGASALGSDIVNASSFIDAYGNNASYLKGNTHYFLINVGSTDSALYLFQDDTGADDVVVPDELTPVAYFAGVRTENYTTTDLINVFV